MEFKPDDQNLSEVEKYKKMGFSKLLEDYLTLNFVNYFFGKKSPNDGQRMKIIEDEVFKNRSEFEQEELINSVKKLKESNILIPTDDGLVEIRKENGRLKVRSMSEDDVEELRKNFKI